MNILWFTWKDSAHPLAGGAEKVNEGIASQLVQHGHNVIFIVTGFPGSAAEAHVNGYKIVRLGNQWSVYLRAYQYYKKHLQGWADVAIDEVNTIPFFLKWYVQEKNILLIYQLCHNIWFYQMTFPLNILGYLLEPLYLRSLKNRFVLTESESTKQDLIHYGYVTTNICVFPIGLETPPLSVETLRQQKKFGKPVLLYVGSLRKMKRPHHVLQAYLLAKKHIPELQLWIAGSGCGSYANSFLNQLQSLPCKNDIMYWGSVSHAKKLELMSKAHIIAATSVKEGWGLIVTEANSQGTPAIVYNVDGLRDSCKDGVTGIVCKVNNPETLACNVIQLLHDNETYKRYCVAAWNDSRRYTFQAAYAAIARAIF